MLENSPNRKTDTVKKCPFESPVVSLISDGSGHIEDLMKYRLSPLKPPVCKIFA